MKIPVTSRCTPMSTPGRLVVDLTDEGLPEIPALGMNRSTRMVAGTAFLHRHPCFEITYCVHGSVKIDCNGRRYPIMPGGVFVAGPRDVHRLQTYPKGAKVYWLFLRMPKKGGCMLGLPPEESAWIVRSFRSLPLKAFAAPQEVRGGFERLLGILDAEKPRTVGRKLKLRAAVVQLLIALAEAGASADEGIRDIRFQTFVDRMRREPKKAFSMNEAAAELRCSPNTVRAHFKRYTGLSPQSFMMKCRIRRAEDFLRKEKLSVTEIAAALGFSSSQNFAIRFRQETGMSPTGWKKANVKM